MKLLDPQIAHSHLDDSGPGIQPITLRAKEGLALINGTDGMLGMLVLALADLDMLCARPTSPRR